MYEKLRLSTSSFSGMVVPAIFIVVAGYVGCNKILAVLFLSLGVGCGGIAVAGYNVNHLDLAPPFAGKFCLRFKNRTNLLVCFS